MITILQTVVGSTAHGTSTPESDIDLRTVYIQPTHKVVGIGTYNKFIENKELDENSWELAHYLYLTLRANPSTYEVLLAKPQIEMEWGRELRSLFPHFLNRKHVYNAFKGFGTQQMKKMLSPTTGYFRKPKAASHFIRVIYNGIELLSTGTFTVRIIDTPVGDLVLAAKRNEMKFEEVLRQGEKLLLRMDKAYENSVIPLEANKEIINDFLIKVRREYW